MTCEIICVIVIFLLVIFLALQIQVNVLDGKTEEEGKNTVGKEVKEEIINKKMD